MNTLIRFCRWLWTGMPGKPTPPSICDLCARDHCVHDVRTGQCLYPWCRCDRSAP